MAAFSRVGSNRRFPKQHVVIPILTSPPSPPAPAYEDCIKHTAATFHFDDDGPTSVANGAGRAGRVGHSPTPSSNEGRITRVAADTGDDAGGAPKISVPEEAIEMRYDAYVWVDFLRKYWILFVVGNLISAAVVIAEASQVNDCFDDVTESQAGATADAGILRETEASIRFLVIALLVFGLVTELVCAVVLSSVYESPLDIKSLRKIPPQDVPTCAASVAVNLVAPFSWGIVYTGGSFVSLQLEIFSSCGGNEEAGLEMYLEISGWVMLLIGLGMLGLSGFLAIFTFSCGSPDGSNAEKCCVADRRMYGHRILSKAALLDVFWQAQGSVWLYRTGGIGGRAFVLLVVLCLVGGILAALGSRAPDPRQELQGSSTSAVTQQPDAADGA